MLWRRRPENEGDRLRATWAPERADAEEADPVEPTADPVMEEADPVAAAADPVDPEPYTVVTEADPAATDELAALEPGQGVSGTGGPDYDRPIPAPSDTRDEKLRYIQDADRNLERIETRALAGLEQLAAAERELQDETAKLHAAAAETEQRAAEAAREDASKKAQEDIDELTNELRETRERSAAEIDSLRSELARERAERSTAIADAERRAQEAAERARAAERAGAEAAARARTGAADWLREQIGTPGSNGSSPVPGESEAPAPSAGPNA
ncbi:MAG: hypothetical protein ACR2N5_05690 [Solirubrobacterales bacterium]